MNMNVLKDFPYSKRYYWTHPWKFFKECWINLTNAWMRATKGYCYTDLWNTDDWFLTVFPKMLRHLAAEHNAYPGSPPFDTSEKWERWLIEMAENLEYVASDSDEENEYADEFTAVMDNCHEVRKETGAITYELDDKGKEIRDKYYNRTNEIAESQQQLLEDTMTELGQHLRCLWD